MKYINGNLIDLALREEFQVIIHGANCQTTMSAGIALQIKNNFPEAFKADLDCKLAPEEKLGTKSMYFVLPNSIKYGFAILNAHTQLTWRGRGVLVDYKALRKCFKKIKYRFPSDFKIAYPKIDAGLAGGDWAIISNIIDEELEGRNHTCVIYNSQC